MPSEWSDAESSYRDEDDQASLDGVGVRHEALPTWEESPSPRTVVLTARQYAVRLLAYGLTVVGVLATVITSIRINEEYESSAR